MDGLTETIAMDNLKSESSRSVDEDDAVLIREESNSSNDKDNDNGRAIPIKLLLMRTPWYIIGLVVLVTGVVLSQYTIHLPYEADCDDVYSDNDTNSTATYTNYTKPY